MLNKSIIAALLPLAISSSVLATELTVEELRLPLASEKMPNVVNLFKNNLSAFTGDWQNSKDFQEAKQQVLTHSQKLWRTASKQLQSASEMDDRPLYWARLQASKVMRSIRPKFELSTMQQQRLLTLFEQGSRGQLDLDYVTPTTKKILLTGFDPFLLDRNINQSNPSGIAALWLDGKVIEFNGISAEINTVMIPVRYQDFDDGMIESVLAPFYALNSVDMVVTVSMGREHFDLERFPGKRRSVTAPGNLNVLSGGSQAAPIISKLNNRPLPGEEFVEFSLPVSHMQKAQGDYKVIDNHKITSIFMNNPPKTFEPASLSQLNGHIAVSGSGGGYLSNEISYRSIRLRNELNSTIPTGHIHTPRIQQFEPKTEAKIVEQIQRMLEQALVAI